MKRAATLLTLLAPLVAVAPGVATAQSGWYFTPAPEVEPELSGGYQFSDNFALELNYFEPLNRYREDPLDEPLDYDLGLDDYDRVLRPEGLGLRAVGILPLRENFSAFGKAGVVSRMDALDFGQNRTRIGGYSLPGFVDPASEAATDLTYGAGMRYDFRGGFGVRFEWERYQDVREPEQRDLLGIGLDYRMP